MGKGSPGGSRAIALTGSSTVVGLHWVGVASGGTGFVGSVPLGGKVELECVSVCAGRGSVVGDPHRFQLAVGTNVPGSQAELDSVQQVFPSASQVAGVSSGLVVPGESGCMVMPVQSVVAFGGRRLVGGFYNGNARTVDAYVAVVMHRVSGGAIVQAFGFLWGERVGGV